MKRLAFLLALLAGAARAEDVTPLHVDPNVYLMAAAVPAGATQMCLVRESTGEQYCQPQVFAVHAGTWTFGGVDYVAPPGAANIAAWGWYDAVPGEFTINVTDPSTTRTSADRFVIEPPASLPRPALLVPEPFQPQPPQTQVLFSDGFESGDASAWTSTLGQTAYPTSGCRSGSHCGSKTLSAGSDQASVYWSKDFTYAGEVITISAWYRFPQGYSWNGGTPQVITDQNYHHKMLIMDTADSVGRTHLNLTGNGSSPTFRLEVESVGVGLGDPLYPGGYTNTRWPTDGGWHHVELEMTRRPGAGNGHARIWLDGALIHDKAGTTCGSTCSPVIRLKEGAYVNQGAAVAETFYMDDILISAGPRQ